MKIVKSIYSKNNLNHSDLEKGVGNLLGDLENYSTQIISDLHLPGSSTSLRTSLRHGVNGLRNYDFDLYERLISFGRTLRILVDSTRAMNKEITRQIEYPLRSLIRTYSHIAFQTKHKEITDTAHGLMKDVADDPNEVSFVMGY